MLCQDELRSKWSYTNQFAHYYGRGVSVTKNVYSIGWTFMFVIVEKQSASANIFYTSALTANAR